jgi:hypothetical protein
MRLGLTVVSAVTAAIVLLPLVEAQSCSAGIGLRIALKMRREFPPLRVRVPPAALRILWQLKKKLTPQINLLD